MNRRSFILKVSLIFSAFGAGIKETFSFNKKKFPSLILPFEKRFNLLRKVFNSFIQKKSPKAILFTKDILETSRFLMEIEYKDEPLLMRSGGHSYAGFSTGEGVILDSRPLDNFDLYQEYTKVSSGHNLINTIQKLDSAERTFPVGSFSGVGLAGYLLGGGHSNRSPYFGLGADNVRAMDVVLASGDRLTNISENNYSDLFWAMLGGGGGNFAFVENFYLDKIIKTNDYFFKAVYGGSQVKGISDLFSTWEQISGNSENNVSLNLTVYIQNGYINKFIISGLFIDEQKSQDENDEFVNREYLTKLYFLKPQRFESRFISSNYLKESRTESMNFKGSAHYADTFIGKQGFEHILNSVKTNTTDMNMYMGFYKLGGGISSPKRDISYPHRSSKYMVDIFSNFRDQKHRFDELNYKFNNHYFALDELFSGRAYINYPNLDFDNWAERYYGDNLNRLLKVKRKYDPQNRFNFKDQSLSSLLI